MKLDLKKIGFCIVEWIEWVRFMFNDVIFISGLGLCVTPDNFNFTMCVIC